MRTRLYCKIVVLCGVVAGFGGDRLRADDAKSTTSSGATSLTIYSTALPGAIPPEMYKPGRQKNTYGAQWRRQIPGYAIVKQERLVDFPQRRVTIRFTDVAREIEPTTVRFSSLTDPDGTRVLEQNYEFDLVSTQKLMQKFLGREITVEKAHGDKLDTFTGKLLSADGGIVLQDESGEVQVISGYSNIRFPELPGGLITKPTLVWDVVTSKPGTHQTRVTYETKAMTWWADYNIVFAPGKDANSGVLDIGAWVSIINQSGAAFPEAKLKLIAGDVHRAPQVGRGAGRMRARVAMAEMKSVDGGFAEKSFFEYHLYTLGRPTTLPNNSTKQIELFPAARNVPCEKVMLYYGQAGAYYGVFGSPMVDRNFGLQSNKKVDVYLRFKNEKEVGMGMPLPAGRIRVSKLDPADNSLEFIGEDTIDHTPKDEVVLIKLGSAFDVVGQRRQVDFNVDGRRDTMTETIEIKLRNHKDEKVKVIVKENLYRWSNWEIIKKSHNFEKIDSRTIHFPVEIDKDGEVTVRYTVKYSW